MASLMMMMMNKKMMVNRVVMMMIMMTTTMKMMISLGANDIFNFWSKNGLGLIGSKCPSNFNLFSYHKNCTANLQQHPLGL